HRTLSEHKTLSVSWSHYPVIAPPSDFYGGFHIGHKRLKAKLTFVIPGYLCMASASRAGE
ncbi:hypothetical protein, partial [Pantoea septica]|uniref:hypothetical protein n=1 Tax=Pantoea septica TaxID=472695 RepID=UPI0028A7DC1E